MSIVHVLGVSNNFGNANYWHSARTLGSNSEEVFSATEKQSIGSSRTWRILVILTLVLTGMVLALQIYNTVTIRNSQPSANIITSTTGTTAAVTTSTLGTTATENILCVSGFFYFDDFDKLASGQPVELNETFFIISELFQEGVLEVLLEQGVVNFKQMTQTRVSIPLLPSTYTTENEDQHFHYHNVTSPLELEAVGCLVENKAVDRAYVFTWFNVTNQNSEQRTFQAIVAFVGQSKTYIIRNYGDNVPSSGGNQVGTYVFDSKGDLSYVVDKTVPATQYAGKRIITKLSVDQIPASDFVLRENEQCGC